VILSDGPELHVVMPELSGDPGAVAPHSLEPSWVALERARILQALKEAKGMVGGANGAAARLGVKRTTLQSRMRRYNIARLYK